MKRKNKLVIAVSVATLVLSAPLSSWAKEKKSAPPATAANVAPSSSTAVSPTAKLPKSIPYHGKISDVDQAAKTFSIPGREKMRIFTMTETTIITKEGSPATMADVVADEDVRGSYWKRADGTLEARTVKLGQKSGGETSKSKKKKKEKAESDTTETPPPKP